MSQVHMPEGWKFIAAEPSAEAGDEAIQAVEEACRRMDVLARELNCLGFFPDECDDGPRAA